MPTQRFAHRFVRSACIALALILLVSIPALAAFTPSNGQAAKLVLGQPDFTSNASNTTRTGMNFPYAMAVDPTTHKVFVVENNNSRVLRFASVYALTNGAAAEAVFGQPNFTSNAGHTTQNGMNGPVSVFVDSGGRLWVAEYNNSRVLRFDHAATLPSGANANGVLGQPNFTSNGTATSQKGMGYPYGLAVDAGGRLWVSDGGNNRVLRFNNAASKANGAKADGVLGQPDFTSNTYVTTRAGMYDPSGVTLDNASGRLYVSDFGNSRVLVFNAAVGLANGANASYVLGQKDFTTGTANTGGISSTTLYYPSAVFYDQAAKVLWVADTSNNRVLMYGNLFTSLSTTSTAAYDGWVLESTAASHVGGSLSATGLLHIGDDASNRQYRSILSFNTAGLPDNAVIHSVTLKIKKSGVAGTDPLTSNALGPFVADIKKGSFGASALEVGDFQATSSASAVANFSPIDAGWYKLVLPASDFTYINRTGVTQFRLRFSSASNNNHVADYDSFYAGDSTAADRPILSVQYNLP